MVCIPIHPYFHLNTVQCCTWPPLWRPLYNTTSQFLKSNLYKAKSNWKLNSQNKCCLSGTQKNILGELRWHLCQEAPELYPGNTYLGESRIVVLSRDNELQALISYTGEWEARGSTNLNLESGHVFPLFSHYNKHNQCLLGIWVLCPQKWTKINFKIKWSSL